MVVVVAVGQLAAAVGLPRLPGVASVAGAAVGVVVAAIEH